MLHSCTWGEAQLLEEFKAWQKHKTSQNMHRVDRVKALEKDQQSNLRRY